MSTKLATTGMVNTSSTNWDRSDEELMSELAAGRREALGPVHSRYASLIFELAARSLDRATAEEITQEVFLTVWQKAATFDPTRGTLRAWVSQITQTRVLNELRRRGRRPRTTSGTTDAGSEYLADSEPGPAEAVWHEHRRAAVRAAVDALPPPQREALSLAFLEDLTHEQVADFLKLPLGTTKSRIRSGLKALRGSLAPLVASGLILAGTPHASPVSVSTPNRPPSASQAAPWAWSPIAKSCRDASAQRPASTRRRTATIAAVPESTWPS